MPSLDGFSDAEYARDEAEWSDRQEAGEFDADNYEFGLDGLYHSKITKADQTASDAAIEHAEAQAA
jgi:hypothetical protein